MILTTDYVRLRFYKYIPPFSEQGGGTVGATQADTTNLLVV